MLNTSQLTNFNDLGDVDNTWEGIYDKLKRIKQTQETASFEATIEPELSSKPITPDDSAVLTRICRLNAKSSYQDTEGPKYESEFQWRIKIAERRATSSAPLLVDSSVFDVGLVKDSHGEDVSGAPFTTVQFFDVLSYNSNLTLKRGPVLFFLICEEHADINGISGYG